MAEMAHFASADEWDRWEVPHGVYHHLLTGKCGPRFDATLRELFEHSGRYRRRYTLSELTHTRPLGDLEHRAILDAAKAGNTELAATRLVHHLARTALTLIEATDPDHEPTLLHETLMLLTGTTALPTEAELKRALPSAPVVA